MARRSDTFGAAACVKAMRAAACDWGVSFYSPRPATAPGSGSHWPFFIDTGSAAQSLNPDSAQRGIRGDWNTQRPCSDPHLNKLDCKNTPAEDTGTNMKEWDTDLSRSTSDNQSGTSECLNLDKQCCHMSQQQENNMENRLEEFLRALSDTTIRWTSARQLIIMMKRLHHQHQHRNDTSSSEEQFTGPPPWH